MNHLHVYTKSLIDGTYDVYFGVKLGVCEGKIHVDIQDTKLPGYHEEAAELSAINEILLNYGLNISPTGKGLLIQCSCYEIQALKEQESEQAYLADYAHLLSTQYADAKIEWFHDNEWVGNRSDKYCEYTLNITKPFLKKEPCQLLGEGVVITRHVITRALQRYDGFSREARAYQSLVKMLNDPSLIELDKSASRIAHNEVCHQKKSDTSKDLFHSGTNLKLVVVKDKDGDWKLTTCVQHVRR